MSVERLNKASVSFAPDGLEVSGSLRGIDFERLTDRAQTILELAQVRANSRYLTYPHRPSVDGPVISGRRKDKMQGQVDRGVIYAASGFGNNIRPAQITARRRLKRQLNDLKRNPSLIDNPINLPVVVRDSLHGTISQFLDSLAQRHITVLLAELIADPSRNGTLPFQENGFRTAERTLVNQFLFAQMVLRGRHAQENQNLAALNILVNAARTASDSRDRMILASQAIMFSMPDPDEYLKHFIFNSLIGHDTAMRDPRARASRYLAEVATMNELRQSDPEVNASARIIDDFARDLSPHMLGVLIGQEDGDGLYDEHGSTVMLYEDGARTLAHLLLELPWTQSDVKNAARGIFSATAWYVGLHTSRLNHYPSFDIENLKDALLAKMKLGLTNALQYPKDEDLRNLAWASVRAAIKLQKSNLLDKKSAQELFNLNKPIYYKGRGKVISPPVVDLQKVFSANTEVGPVAIANMKQMGLQHLNSITLEETPEEAAIAMADQVRQMLLGGKLIPLEMDVLAGHPFPEAIRRSAGQIVRELTEKLCARLEHSHSPSFTESADLTIRVLGRLWTDLTSNAKVKLLLGEEDMQTLVDDVEKAKNRAMENALPGIVKRGKLLLPQPQIQEGKIVTVRKPVEIAPWQPAMNNQELFLMMGYGYAEDDNSSS